MAKAAKKKVKESKDEDKGDAKWVEYGKSEAIEIIVDLAKSGKKPSEIGLVLRDQYGIGDVYKFTGKKLTRILAENGIKANLPESLENLLRRALQLRKHLEQHKRDAHNDRALILIESRIRKLLAYYKRKKILPTDMYYDRAQIELLLK